MQRASVPPTLQAGDSIVWTCDLPEYPADAGWALGWRLINADGKFDVVASPDGARHRVTLAAAATADYAPGHYTWIAHVTKSGERYTIARGTTQVLPDWTTADQPADARSPAQRALEDLRAALARWMSSQGHVQTYQIGGRSMTFASVAEIQRRIALAEAEVAREQAQLGGRSQARKVLVRY